MPKGASEFKTSKRTFVSTNKSSKRLGALIFTLRAQRLPLGGI
jgi:hypothetical protein